MSGKLEKQRINCLGNAPRQLPVAWDQWASETIEERARNKANCQLSPPPDHPAAQNLL